MKKWILILSFVLTGCAHFSEWKFFSPVNPPSDKQALIYIYHDCSKGKLDGFGPQLYVNGVDRAYMPKGSYFATYISPELNMLEVCREGNAQYLQFYAEPKQISFFKIQSNYKDRVTNITKVSADVAKTEITKCRLAKTDYYSSYDAF